MATKTYRSPGQLCSSYPVGGFVVSAGSRVMRAETLRKWLLGSALVGSLLALTGCVFCEQPPEPVAGESEIALPGVGTMRVLFRRGGYTPLNEINNMAEFVGSVPTGCLRSEAFVCSDSRFNRLGTLGGPKSHAADINDRGQIVGSAETERFARQFPVIGGVYAERESLAVLWEDGRTVPLGRLEGAKQLRAKAINDVEQIVGNASMPFAEMQSESAKSLSRATTILPLPTRAVSWERIGDAWVATDLHPPDAFTSEALDINNQGQIVGWIWGSQGSQATLWEDGEGVDLGALSSGKDSEAVAINNNGQIVGWSRRGRSRHATLWQDGEIIDLGTLGGRWSEATDVNNHGQVAGMSERPARPGEFGDWIREPFLWRDGVMINLNDRLPADSPWRIAPPDAINDNGQILTQATNEPELKSFIVVITLSPDLVGEQMP